MIVAMAGLPGTGKTTITGKLARLLPAAVLDKDRIRPALFTSNGVDYTREQDDFCFTVMLMAAAFHLARDPEQTVILDGRTFSRSYQVNQAAELAERTRQQLAIIECVCTDDTARRRLHHDRGGALHPAANRTYALHQAIKATAEPLPARRLVVDTDTSLDICIAQCMTYLGAHRAGARG
jgi:adenylylsulfate kinase